MAVENEAKVKTRAWSERSLAEKPGKISAHLAKQRLSWSFRTNKEGILDMNFNL